MKRKDYPEKKLRRWADNEKDIVVSAGVTTLSESADPIRPKIEGDCRDLDNVLQREPLTTMK